MDCGPASLKALLEGFQQSANYGRLREVCQTDVDGTSIDTLEEVAVQLGLNAEQQLLPPDSLLLPSAKALPALVIVRLPNNNTHFVVLWNQLGPFIQLMDPAVGRRWLTVDRFLQEVYLHTQAVPTEAWEAWARDDSFGNPLRDKIKQLGTSDGRIEALLAQALAAEGWFTLAALDATTRLVNSLVQAQGLSAGPEALAMFDRLFAQVVKQPEQARQIIPADYWLVWPDDNDPEETLLMRGVVILSVDGLLNQNEAETTADENLEEDYSPPFETTLSDDVIATLNEPESSPEKILGELLLADSRLIVTVLLIALGLSAGLFVVEILLFRGMLEVGQSLTLVGQRVGAAIALTVFLVGVFLLDIPTKRLLLRLGRLLEIRLRLRFLQKIPHLPDRYFQSRLTSDMIQRAYNIRDLRILPMLGAEFLLTLFRILFTTHGIMWLMPWSMPLIGVVLLAITLPVLLQPILIEQDLRWRTHTGTLTLFYLDALLGLIPIRTHGAEKAVQREYESLLTHWAEAGLSFYSSKVILQVGSIFITSLTVVLIVISYLAQDGAPHNLLLLIYWCLDLPVLGQNLASIIQQYPSQRNRTLRVLELLDVPEEQVGGQQVPLSPQQEGEENPSPSSERRLEERQMPNTQGLHIQMQDVMVNAGGHTVLQQISLEIKPGEHIALVGPSGAGKSSLVGLLLGWYWPDKGQLLVDGKPLTQEALQLLRRQTAWIDPSVQLWNRTLLTNLRYGTAADDSELTNLPLAEANLLEVLQRLPDGMETQLGEAGRMVSGGQGQRIRLGRAMFRPDIRLVILDEPFRGLDRSQRAQLLDRVRAYWSEATLIFISHDIEITSRFERVVVIEQGQVAEDALPAILTAQVDSRYSALLQAEQLVRREMWQAATWHHLWMADGKVQPKSSMQE